MTTGVSAGDRRATGRLVTGYLLLALLPGAAAMLVVMGLADGGTGGGRGSPAVDALTRLLLAVAVVVAVAHLFGWVARKLGQPAVVGEMLGGILLGPSLLGAAAPGLTATLFPASALPVLDGLAQLGVIFFMFMVGYELPARLPARTGSASVAIGHSAMALPLLLGVLLALWLRPAFQPPGVSTAVFALFVGVALSVTAFPVLARILTDRGLHRTEVGTLGLGAAAVGDVTCWCLLAVVFAMSGRSTPTGIAVMAAGSVLLVIAAMRLRPLLVRALDWAQRRQRQEAAMVAMACLLLLMALATHLIGVHAIFGAFLFGVVAPRGSPVVEGLVRGTAGFTGWILLPLFFVSVGLRTHFGAVTSAAALLPLALILLVAVAGKVGGAAVQARMQGRDGPDALALGAMMNCRGLTELIVLDIGRGLGIIPEPLFVLLVVMTLVTTVATAPLLHLAQVWRRRREAAAPHPPTPAGASPAPSPSRSDRADR